MSDERKVSTTHLGQFTHGHAERIAAELEERGIVWWYKQPGFLSSVWEFGVRLFVDREHLEEAREIARRTAAPSPGADDPDAEA